MHVRAEPTMSGPRWAHHERASRPLLTAIANSKMWRVSEDIVETVAPMVEQMRHDNHDFASASIYTRLGKRL